MGAFYDGGQTWRARFSCRLPGTWRWSTAADGPADAGLSQAGAVTCAAASGDVPHLSGHGALLIDPAHPHHFVWQDGARFFPMSYECDWCYALGLEADSTPTPLESFLDSLALGSYNMVRSALHSPTAWPSTPATILG